MTDQSEHGGGTNLTTWTTHTQLWQRGRSKKEKNWAPVPGRCCWESRFFQTALAVHALIQLPRVIGALCDGATRPVMSRVPFSVMSLPLSGREPDGPVSAVVGAPTLSARLSRVASGHRQLKEKLSAVAAKQQGEERAQQDQLFKTATAQIIRPQPGTFDCEG